MALTINAIRLLRTGKRLVHAGRNRLDNRRFLEAHPPTAMARPTSPIDLSPKQEKLLQSIACSREVPHGLVQRAKIVLAVSQGHTNKAIASGIVRGDGGLMEKALGTRQCRPVGAKAQTLARRHQRLVGRSPASWLSWNFHGGADLPDYGDRLRKTAGTARPLDPSGRGPRSHPARHCRADFRDQCRFVF